MKRYALWCVALSLCAAAGGLEAQGLTMQTSNGWTFSFSGNVNAFAVYTDGKVDRGGTITGGLVTPEKASRIRTGLLPGYATLSATGKEGGLDLGVHFSFAPQIQSNSLHDNFGAQIDMREVYLTVGGSWGQILAGREIGLYQRQNILTDMTLSGTGASGPVVGAGGTTLGRIGFGYIYPNFNAQITYSTPAGKPAQLSVGIFDPSVVCPQDGCSSASGAAYSGTKIPRVEAELTWTGNLGGGTAATTTPSSNTILLWANGMVQKTDQFATDVPGDNPSITSTGVGGGIKLALSGLSLVGSGYYGNGVGTTLMFGQLGGALDATGAKRKSYGYIGQATFQAPNSRWMLGASYGDSRLKTTDNDPADAVNDLVKSNRSIDGLLTFQWTKALKWVANYTWATSESFSDHKVKSNQLASGFMLFF
ncbi:MAG TPA: hypothetical protein VFK39_13600 [Gemmatimonadaceae bacterium]|nr:hypothetical protein [Gemmatimonadaceae bacterium]